MLVLALEGDIRVPIARQARILFTPVVSDVGQFVRDALSHRATESDRWICPDPWVLPTLCLWARLLVGALEDFISQVAPRRMLSQTAWPGHAPCCRHDCHSGRLRLNHLIARRSNPGKKRLEDADQVIDLRRVDGARHIPVERMAKLTEKIHAEERGVQGQDGVLLGGEVQLIGLIRFHGRRGMVGANLVFAPSGRSQGSPLQHPAIFMVKQYNGTLLTPPDRERASDSRW